MQCVIVRATSHEQLKALGDRLSGAPSTAALELDLSFGKNKDLHLGTVGNFFCNAGLTERVRAVKYCCQRVLGTDLFPGSETPVSAELWSLSPPDAFWNTLSDHSLVKIHMTVLEFEYALSTLQGALRWGSRLCGTLRCLQVDHTCTTGRPSLPMCEFTAVSTPSKLGQQLLLADK